MSENQHRYGDSEDTTRIPRDDFDPSADDDRNHTSVLPTYEQAGHPSEHPYAEGHTGVFPPLPPAAPVGSEPSRRRGRGVGLLVGSLLLGTAGGFGGAAAYSELNPDDATSGGTTNPVRSTVNDDAEPDTAAAPGSPEAVAAAVLPSVVKINVAGEDGAGSGSGVILSSDGEILTNDHVVEVANEGGRISVSFNDGSTASAEIVGTDPVTDLAVIKAEGVSDLTPAAIGSSDNLDVGEGVVAIGSPFGLEATVTSGIVSALNRPVTVGESAQGNDTTYPAIQTDAAINPGNSGGPLVNLDSEVVGINSSIRTSGSSLGGEAGSIGLGFAIPISKVLPIVEQLRAGETPTHARLGVTVSNATDENDAIIPGAQIQEITPGSAGAKAGLEKGDVVTRVNDDAITSLESLVATIRGYRPGDEVTLTVLRDGERLTLEATLDSDADDS